MKHITRRADGLLMAKVGEGTIVAYDMTPESERIFFSMVRTAKRAWSSVLVARDAAVRRALEGMENIRRERMAALLQPERRSQPVASCPWCLQPNCSGTEACRVDAEYERKEEW